MHIILPIIFSAAACYFDLKYMEIPNAITFPMIFIGIVICILKLNPYYYIPLAISFIFLWLIWKAGIWGGGDAKLTMGIISLIYPYNIYFIPNFFIWLGLISMAHYFVFGLIEEMKKGNIAKFLSTVSAISLLTLSIYLISNALFPPFSIYVTAVSFFIIGDILGSFLPCKEETELSEELVGKLLAEKIGIKNGKIIRIEKETSIILRIYRALKGKERIKILAEDELTKEKIEELKKYCKKVKIYISYPMAPIIFISLLTANFLEIVKF